MKLLAETDFPGDADIGDPYLRANKSVSRANNYRRCSRAWVGMRCVACRVDGRNVFAYRQVVRCHLRGCPRCGHTTRWLTRKVSVHPLDYSHFVLLRFVERPNSLFVRAQ